MNDEEIKAIERLKNLLQFNLRNPFLEDEADDIITVLNLIEKQKEEINYKDEEMFNIVNSDKGKLYKENQELKAMELKAKGGAVRITLEGLINLNNEIKQRDKEIEKKDKIINDAIKWIENTMNDSRVTGCNLGDLQLLFDILKDKK